MEALLWRGLRRLRNDGVLGFLHASRDYAENWWRRRVDASLDKKFGIDTQGIVLDPRKLGGIGPHIDNSTGYQPIQIPVFRDVMRALPVAPSRYVFVDYGSGKGRAVLLAALYGFARVIGIELAPGLHATACANLAHFLRARPHAPPIELLCEDAARYALPPVDAVCFLYNPFDALVMQRVLANIEASVIRDPRSLWVVYRNPVHAPLLDDAPFLTLVAARHAFRIYCAARPGEKKGRRGAPDSRLPLFTF